jgi:hypothetical protein
MRIDMYELYRCIFFVSIIGWLGWVAFGNFGGVVLSMLMFTGGLDVHKKVSELSISDGGPSKKKGT